MDAETATVIGFPGGRDKPRFVPSWAPTGSTLAYLANALVVAVAILALLALVGLESAGRLRGRLR